MWIVTLTALCIGRRASEIAGYPLCKVKLSFDLSSLPRTVFLFSREDAPFLTKNMRAAKNMEKAFHYKEVREYL